MREDPRAALPIRARTSEGSSGTGGTGGREWVTRTAGTQTPTDSQGQEDIRGSLPSQCVGRRAVCTRAGRAVLCPPGAPAGPGPLSPLLRPTRSYTARTSSPAREPTAMTRGTERSRSAGTLPPESQKEGHCPRDSGILHTQSNGQRVPSHEARPSVKALQAGVGPEPRAGLPVAHVDLW